MPKATNLETFLPLLLFVGACQAAEDDPVLDCFSR